MAVRMRKVLARPWVGVRVCHLLLLSFYHLLFILIYSLIYFTIEWVRVRMYVCVCV